MDEAVMEVVEGRAILAGELRVLFMDLSGLCFFLSGVESNYMTDHLQAKLPKAQSLSKILPGEIQIFSGKGPFESFE
jgi:hypothetical protein